MNRSIWILPGITGFSVQMVSAPKLSCSDHVQNYIDRNRGENRYRFKIMAAVV